MRKIQIILIFAACLFFVASTVTAQKAKNTMTNADVIEMVKAGLPESTIILAIQQSEPNFDTSTKALIELSKQNVSQKILDAMLQVQVKSTNKSENREATSISVPIDKSDTTPKPVLETPTYRVTVESLVKKANNYTATLIFENLTDKTIGLGWLEKSSGVWKDEGPYLIDEKGNKYFAEGVDSANIIKDGFTYWEFNAQILPKTKLKSRFLFFGSGSGKIFTLKASELKDMKTKPISIDGIKVTLDEDKVLSNEVLTLPTLNTAFYRVVIESAKRIGEDVVLTLVFESLADNPFQLSWGQERRSSYQGGGWKSGSLEITGPYLIDENADRFYMRNQDIAGVVIDEERDYPLLLPKTKLKTQFVFHVAGKGKIFTLGCKEISPKEDQPIVIEGIKPQ